MENSYFLKTLIPLCQQSHRFSFSASKPHCFPEPSLLLFTKLEIGWMLSFLGEASVVIQ